MFEKEYNFILEIWENKDKLIGTRDIKVKAFTDAGAIEKAWEDAKLSLTHSYFYSIKYK